MKNDGTVLVTGASGFLGRRIVQKLVEHGHHVHALVRSSSKTESLQLPGVELFYGDVTDMQAVDPAFEGIDYVIHAAAGTVGPDAAILRTTVEGTRNILALSMKHKPEKLVYISSCAVYGVGEYQLNQRITEQSPLERYPEKRGIYSWSKIEAERIVTGYMQQENTRIVCLRPGTIFGRGGRNFSPMIGFAKNGKYFVVINRRDFILPLVYVDNLVDAVMLVMTNRSSSGQIYNVVDPYQIDKRYYMDTFIRKLYPGSKVLYFPYSLLAGAVSPQERMLLLLGRKPYISRYRLLSSQNPVVYSSDKIMKELGWTSLHTFEDAIAGILAASGEGSGSQVGCGT